jgi:hypothetical protein
VSNLDLFSGKDKTEIAIECLRLFEPKDGSFTGYGMREDAENLSHGGQVRMICLIGGSMKINQLYRMMIVRP